LLSARRAGTGEQADIVGHTSNPVVVGLAEPREHAPRDVSYIVKRVMSIKPGG
jgi:hypothetical protein